MAWEARGRRRYFYRSARRGGRVVKEYYGRGGAAGAAERLLAGARAPRAAETESLRVLRQAYAPLDRLMGELDGACRHLTEQALRAAGYRKTVNHEWRRG